MPDAHPARESLKEVIRSRRVGNWDLTEPLGRGGQGTTWRAIWKGVDHSLTRISLNGGDLRRSVVKLMLPPDPQEWAIPATEYAAFLETQVEHFVRECEVLAGIKSPFIPLFLGIGREQTQAGWSVPWFAVELIAGRTLGEQRAGVGPLDHHQILELAHDILSALSAVHDTGLVHLDLKPDNVMLEPAKSRLIDFGLATQAYRIQRGSSGTPGYFAPEQLDGVTDERDFAPEVDLYKLGITLAVAAGIDLADLWGVDPYGPRDVLVAAMRRGVRLDVLTPIVRDVVAPLLAFKPSERGTANATLARVTALLPADSWRANGTVPAPAESDTTIRPPDAGSPVRSAAAAVGGAPEANVGAKVVVVDQMGLDWKGVVVGLDPKRHGAVLVRLESARGTSNVRSYPLERVTRGKALK
ncbi:serine/threonine-protein kinase [Luteimicrobium subarcticum]|uniref:Serine/threonine protein kinase n=1 Tax=Luteimicrobium subarcticum TaxID=620910 RepID=A0A2M8WRK7_9MICO|nr:serine/threonine-protein kinase [Luteimicrobium subarcticum]PJI93562.1 serine/threonine protein kinase [Luteimicrobium subarcticum]